MAWSGEGEGATRLTPHHLLPRLSEDRGRARVRGGVCERVHGGKKPHVYLHARTCLCVSGWVGEWNGRWTGHTPGTGSFTVSHPHVEECPPSPTFLTPAT